MFIINIFHLDKDKTLMFFSVLIIVIGITLPCIIKYCEGWSSVSYNDLSNAGDWLGGTSAPLFSLAGFILMYAAYNSQREELKLTRKEMESTRRELEMQNTNLEYQRIENTFFNLLKLHHDTINAIHYEQYNGREYFNFAYKNLYKEYEYLQIKEYRENRPRKRTTASEVAIENELKIIASAYELFFENHQHYLGHYFRNLYHTMRLINESNLSAYQKENFSKILAAQLSSNEQYLLFYNCFVGIGKYNFKKLIVQYNILDSMNKFRLLDETHWSIFENQKACTK